MKKFAIIASLAFAAASASAHEVGARYTHNGENAGDLVGITLGNRVATPFGPVGVEGSFDRSTRGAINVNRFGVTGAYDVVKFHGATISAKVGVAFIDPSNSGDNGYAATVGVGAAYPVAKSINLVVDYAHQRGQDRVNTFNGNAVSVGIKHSF